MIKFKEAQLVYIEAQLSREEIIEIREVKMNRYAITFH